ncbi:MAG: hypothetical protein RL030_679 [Pseudomonadota bacterium]
MSAVAKLFMSGRSQAVRLPNELRFEGDEVVAKRFGNGVLLLPANAPWELMREALDGFEASLRELLTPCGHRHTIPYLK